MLIAMAHNQQPRRPWLEIYRGFGVGVRVNSHPWNVAGGVMSTLEESNRRVVDDAEWLELKRQLRLRKVEIWVEWWMPADEPERVEVKRERATATVLVFRDAERAMQSKDAVEFGKTETTAILNAVRDALVA